MNPCSVNTEVNRLCIELIKSKMGLDYNPSYFDSKKQIVNFQAGAGLYDIISIPSLIEEFKMFYRKEIF